MKKLRYAIGWFRNPYNDDIDAFRVDRVGDGWIITPYDCVGGKPTGAGHQLTMAVWKLLVPLMEMR